ncbi:Conotoxin LiCr95 [Madurella mycetomatis]|uniref:Conotoxin LiCr95 n=1 Tax=Madurella mycetomatis TaxID=100816 RepID=A0A175VUK1_9PEZI|nr:Conotoxin LiCr95 [Madurella mycetomatis]KXX78068.1 Conotoxin LiCr95 [Madurella mycetomatis]
MQFSFTTVFLLANAVLGLAVPAPAENAAPAQLDKRCIPTGGDCTNRYTECCSQMCSVHRDGTGECF